MAVAAAPLDRASRSSRASQCPFPRPSIGCGDQVLKGMVRCGLDGGHARVVDGRVGVRATASRHVCVGPFVSISLLLSDCAVCGLARSLAHCPPFLLSALPLLPLVADRTRDRELSMRVLSLSSGEEKEGLTRIESFGGRSRVSTEGRTSTEAARAVALKATVVGR